MKITTILESFKGQAPQKETPQIVENIRRIKSICDAQFSNQSFYGSAALNRQMLLDQELSELLTPEVIKYLFTNPPTDKEKIYRNSTGYINIKDAIYYGLLDGTTYIKYMPNNERGYTPAHYKKQQRNFEQYTKQIIENIKIAAGKKEAEVLEETIDIKGLQERFKRVSHVLNLVQMSKNTKELLKVPTYSESDIKNQVDYGFSTLCRCLTVDLKNTNLDDFCKAFLNNEAALLNGDVIHLFYDRVHLEAALVHPKKISIGKDKFTYQQIIGRMITLLSENPGAYSSVAREQFAIRLELVEQDLNKRFQVNSPEFLNKALEDKNWDVFSELIKSDTELDKVFMRRVIDSAAKNNRWDLIYAFEKKLTNEDYLPQQGPLPKSIYTIQLEDLTRKLLQGEAFKCIKLGGHDLLAFNDSLYDMTEILKRANFEQISLERSDFENYQKFLRKEASALPSFEQIDPSDKLNLSQAQAINIYTQNSWYKAMNSLLRGTFPFSGENTNIIKETILHSVICATGLNGIPDNNIEKSYRGENVFNVEVHKGRIAKAAQKGVFSLSGFVSSSTDVSKTGAFGEETLYEFTKLRGKYIAPYSRYKHEAEYLILPTQVKVDDFKFSKNNQQIFSCSLASDLAENDKAIMQEKMPKRYFMHLAVLDLEHFIKIQLSRMKTKSWVNVFYDEKLSRRKIDVFEQLQRDLYIFKTEKLDTMEFKDCLTHLNKLTKDVDEASKLRRKSGLALSNTDASTEFKTRIESLKTVMQHEQATEGIVKNNK